jgi:hypothetical protein
LFYLASSSFGKELKLCIKEARQFLRAQIYRRSQIFVIIMIIIIITIIAPIISTCKSTALMISSGTPAHVKQQMFNQLDALTEENSSLLRTLRQLRAVIF